jgi:hypothetical protein
MTLVLTVATPAFMVQVSDRLVVQPQAGSIKEFDTLANKTILYRATDAIVAISYSGIAYLDSKPTDEWLVEHLWGGPLPRSRDGFRPATYTRERRPNVWNIDTAIKALMRAVDAISQRDVDQGGLIILTAGWQQNRSGYQPFLVEIKRSIRMKCSIITGKARRRIRGRNFLLCRHIGAAISWSHIATAFDRFCVNGCLTVNDVETVLVEQVRQAAGCTVGPNVASVLLNRPDLGPMLCRFHPVAPHYVRIFDGSSVVDTAVAHLPWVCGGSFLSAPRAAIGDSFVDLDEILVRSEGASPTGRLLGLDSAIHRPPFLPAASRTSGPRIPPSDLEESGTN